MATFKLAKMVSGYPLALAGEYTASTFATVEDALAALGKHGSYELRFGEYVGTFNPVHPAASDYFLVARSTQDSSLVVVADSYTDTYTEQD